MTFECRHCCHWCLSARCPEHGGPARRQVGQQTCIRTTPSSFFRRNRRRTARALQQCASGCSSCVYIYTLMYTGGQISIYSLCVWNQKVSLVNRPDLLRLLSSLFVRNFLYCNSWRRKKNNAWNQKTNRQNGLTHSNKHYDVIYLTIQTLASHLFQLFFKVLMHQSMAGVGRRWS